MRETANTEWKEAVSPSFLKTASAFANYGTGIIIFGIADDGTPAPLANPIEDCLRIESMLNDSIMPQISFALDPDMDMGTVTLTIYEGPSKPYLYKGKAYKRSDSASVPVDRIEYSRLVLAGNNQTYDALRASNQELSLARLETSLQTTLGIEELDTDVLRTLGLRTKDGAYNNAALILADANDAPGIDMVRFGASISEILDRETFAGISAIEQYERTLEVFRRYYRYEKIEGSVRASVELVPEKAFREAVANALVHRTWDVSANIQVSMFSDHIEVVSPGGLPTGITEQEYLRGRISVLRNPILADIFFRLNYIEKFGTGVLRIREAYDGSSAGPSFEVLPASISVTLPVIETIRFTVDQQRIISAMPTHIALSRADISEHVGFSKDKTVRLLRELTAMGAVSKSGSGRGTKYLRSR